MEVREKCWAKIPEKKDYECSTKIRIRVKKEI